MKRIALILALMFAMPAFAQKTQCTKTGDDTMTCEPDRLEKAYDERNAAWGFKKPDATAAATNAANAAAAAVTAAANAPVKAKENAIQVNTAYCKQNPTGSVTIDGLARTCADWAAYEQAYCSVNLESDVCKAQRQDEAARIQCVYNSGVCGAPKSKEEVTRALGAISEGIKHDHPNRSSTQMYYESIFTKVRAWGCAAYPDMTLPVWGKVDQPCTPK